MLLLFATVMAGTELRQVLLVLLVLLRLPAAEEVLLLFGKAVGGALGPVREVPLPAACNFNGGGRRRRRVVAAGAAASSCEGGCVLPDKLLLWVVLLVFWWLLLPLPIDSCLAGSLSCPDWAAATVGILSGSVAWELREFSSSDSRSISSSPLSHPPEVLELDMACCGLLQIDIDLMVAQCI